MTIFTVWSYRVFRGVFGALLVISLSGAWGVHAQDEERPGGALDLEKRTIASIKFRYEGPKTVDESRLRDHMSVRAGQKYNPEVLDRDAASLYESGLVEDVSFLGDPSGNDSLVLIVEVATRGQIVEIGFEGNKIFSDRKLGAEAKVQAGVISDSAILEARRKIEKHYKATVILMCLSLTVYGKRIARGSISLFL